MHNCLLIWSSFSEDWWNRLQQTVLRGKVVKLLHGKEKGTVIQNFTSSWLKHSLELRAEIPMGLESQNCKLRRCCLKSLGRKSTRKNKYFNHKENINWCLKWEDLQSPDLQIKSRDKKVVWIFRVFLLISALLACSSLFPCEILILLQQWIWWSRSNQNIFFSEIKTP